METQELNIALAHDTFTQLGGAERVAEVFHEMFPDAPVFALVAAPEIKNKFKGWDIRTSSLQTLYAAFPRLQYFLPLIPSVLDSWNIGDYEMLLSSSSSFIKNIRKPDGCMHVCYCHTPTRFLWHDHDYLNQELPRFLQPFRFMVNWYLKKMRKWDFAKAQKIDFFIANSKEVQKRIKEYYQRDSVVIYPPVDTEFWARKLAGQKISGPENSMDTKRDYFLLAGRLQAHKRNELIIEIFNELGLPLHVVGTGRQEKYLKSVAKANITFYGRLSDEELRQQYSEALGFIYPQIEDAGLMPLEAAACGTATIAAARGGSLETVIPGVTGELFEDWDAVQARGLPREAVKEKIKQLILNWNPEKYPIGQLRVHAEKFSKEKFKQKMEELLHTTEIRGRELV